MGLGSRFNPVGSGLCVTGKGKILHSRTKSNAKVIGERRVYYCAINHVTVPIHLLIIVDQKTYDIDNAKSALARSDNKGKELRQEFLKRYTCLQQLEEAQRTAEEFKELTQLQKLTDYFLPKNAS